jgi:hypothetical protein
LSHASGATGHIDEAAAVRATFAIAPRTADGFKKSDDTQRRHGMNAHVSAILLGVRDMERSKRFYTDGLGWTVQQDFGISVFFVPHGGSLVGFYGRDGLAADGGVSPRGHRL